MKLLTVRKGNFGPQTGSIIEIVSAHAFTYICIYYIQYIQYIQYIKLPDTHYLEPEYLGSIWELGIPKYFECLVFTRSSIQNIVYFMGFIYLGSYNITKTPGSIYHEPHPLDSGLEAEIHQPNPLWSHPTHFSGHIYIFFYAQKLPFFYLKLLYHTKLQCGPLPRNGSKGFIHEKFYFYMCSEISKK